ncbi:MAG TPA: ATP-binding protein [Salinivirgaceae bacterium]|nr:ATP-binding protein [Salinivirgaceae bacterium]
MTFKEFRISLIVRIALLIVTIWASVYVFVVHKAHFGLFFLSILVLVQAWLLYRFLSRVNQKLSLFFTALKNLDHNYNFEFIDEGEPFTGLNRTLNEVVEKFSQLQKTQQQQYYFFQTVLQHIGVGILAYKSDGTVLLINRTASKLLGCGSINHLSGIERKSKGLYHEIEQMGNEQKKLIKTVNDNEVIWLSVYAKVIQQDNGLIKTLAIQNIHSEMEEHEMQSWQKLIRVLTHEIMNSATPIVSLSETLETMMASQDEICRNSADIQLAVQTIRKRSQGLIKFIETYRDLTKIPTPSFAFVSVDDFYSRMKKLFQNECQSKGIIFETKVTPKTLSLMADETLLEQVFINLIRNSIQALEECKNPEIILEGKPNPMSSVILTIKDNGHGILPEVLEKVFIPFFTTRPGGNGIGLALSRQLIKTMGGNISIASQPSNTCVTIRF